MLGTGLFPGIFSIYGLIFEKVLKYIEKVLDTFEKVLKPVEKFSTLVKKAALCSILLKKFSFFLKNLFGSDY